VSALEEQTLTMPAATQVDRYEILRELGRGGMAIVHLARHTTLGRLVALKEMRSVDAASGAAAKRFLEEAQIGGSLQHPNIVPVYDCFEVDGVIYIAMEYLPHGSLREREGPFTIAQLSRVASDVLAGLGAAERHGIVHRDLKPENLLVTDAGGIKIADFGIAKALGGSLTGTRLTTTGIVMGTPEYMAPEQAEGAEVGPATDLYALGVIAYEMLTGDVPFGRKTTPLRALMRRVSEPPPDPCVAVPGIDDSLARWVRRLLATAPSDRPTSAAEAWRAFEPIAIDLGGGDWMERASLLGEPAQDLHLTGYITFRGSTAPAAVPEGEPAPAEALPSPEPSAPQRERAAPSMAVDDAVRVEPLSVTPVREPGASAAGEPELATEAGGGAELAVRVRNQGDTVAAYDLSVDGIPADWWTASPERLHLNPWGTAGESEATATFTFHPPRGAQALARRWDATVRVRRCDRDDPPIEQSLTLGLTVLPFAQLGVRLRPEDTAGRFRGKFTIEASNDGNADAPLDIALRDSSDACRFRLTEKTVVPSGQTHDIKCEVRPRRLRWLGRSITHTVEAEVFTASGGGSGRRVGGRFVQRALLPWWLPILLAVLATAAGAAVLIHSPSRPGPGPGPTFVPSPAPSATQTPDASPSATAQATVRVPNVVGESLARARTLIQARGLDVGTVKPRGFPPSAPVAKQSPAAGKRVAAQSTVGLTLESVVVPDLSGLTETEASSRLEQMRLGEAIAQPWDAGVDATVRKQDPPAGTRVPPDQDVKLQMAKPAPPQFRMSDAREVADQVAARYASGGGISGAAVTGCRAAGPQQWSCVIEIKYLTQSGDAICRQRLAVTPTTDLSGLETSSGLLGAHRITEDDCPVG
jgi:serine/threonine protein kinase/beta-lactam-binding protein with PASTA domain